MSISVLYYVYLYFIHIQRYKVLNIDRLLTLSDDKARLIYEQFNVDVKFFVFIGKLGRKYF